MAPYYIHVDAYMESLSAAKWASSAQLHRMKIGEAGQQLVLDTPLFVCLYCKWLF